MSDTKDRSAFDRLKDLLPQYSPNRPIYPSLVSAGGNKIILKNNLGNIYTVFIIDNCQNITQNNYTTTLFILKLGNKRWYLGTDISLDKGQGLYLEPNGPYLLEDIDYTHIMRGFTLITPSIRKGLNSYIPQTLNFLLSGDGIYTTRHIYGTFAGQFTKCLAQGIHTNEDKTRECKYIDGALQVLITRKQTTVITEEYRDRFLSSIIITRDNIESSKIEITKGRYDGIVKSLNVKDCKYLNSFIEQNTMLINRTFDFIFSNGAAVGDYIVRDHIESGNTTFIEYKGSFVKGAIPRSVDIVESNISNYMDQYINPFTFKGIKLADALKLPIARGTIQASINGKLDHIFFCDDYGLVQGKSYHFCENKARKVSQFAMSQKDQKDQKDQKNIAMCVLDPGYNLGLGDYFPQGIKKYPGLAVYIRYFIDSKEYSSKDYEIEINKRKNMVMDFGIPKVIVDEIFNYYS